MQRGKKAADVVNAIVGRSYTVKHFKWKIKPPLPFNFNDKKMAEKWGSL